MDTATVFETERLLLRPFRTDDLPAVFERTSDPEVMRFHNCGTLSHQDTKAGLEAIIHGTPELLPYGFRALIIKETGENVGYCKLGPLPLLEAAPIEISYDIVRKHWRKGYATEASVRLIRHGFDELRLPEIIAAVNPLNMASARVIQKLGFSVREKVDWPKQGPVDLYVLTRDRCPALGLQPN